MLLYYLIILPLSKVPLRILYLVSPVLQFILHRIVGYRKRVVAENLARAFPEKGSAERRQIAHRYYRHLSRILLESIHNLGMNKQELLQRMQLNNPDLFERLYREGKSVVLVSSHFENWEYFITAQALLIPHEAFGIGKKIKQGFLNHKINDLRERFGMHVIHHQNYRKRIETAISKKPLAVLTLADQSPSPDQAYWHKFLGIDTPFAYGAEYLAHRFGMAVIYLDITQPRPGYYTASGILVTETPYQSRYGEIMNEVVRLQEEQILRKPEAWLWSHRRWKHPAPNSIEDFRKKQEELFRSKFSGESDSGH